MNRVKKATIAPVLKFLSIIGLMLGVLMTTHHAAAAYESPDYKVLEREGAIEIRQYDDAMIAQVTATGNRKESSNQAFRILFNYINGDNQFKDSIKMTSPVIQQPQSQKISMTVPVSQQKNPNGSWNVAFFMPRKFTKETLPDPNDERIKIIELSQGRFATIRFSGMYSTANFQKYDQQLLKYLRDNDLSFELRPIYAYYNSPFTLWFLRRTEIMYQLK